MVPTTDVWRSWSSKMTRAVNIDGRRGPSAILRYGLGVLAVTAATIIQHLGDIHFAVTPSFVCAVMVSGWFGGMGPGLLTTALSILALKYYFVPPTGTFAIDTAYIPSITLFSLVALFVTWLTSRERKGAMSLVHAHDQLDLKIHELEKSNESLQAEIAARTRAEEEIRESERRYSEVQMELVHANRVATMGQLSASIAHEVNQPIGATLNNASAALRWLSKEPADLEKARQALNRIVANGNRVSEVIGRMRALFQKAPLRKEEMDINGAILEVIALTRDEVAKNDISVQSDLVEGLPLIQGDRVQLQQVLMNLIINAVEALSSVSEGSRELVITTGKGEPDGVLVVVRDSGPGLSSPGLERIFEAFYTTKPGGLGMGLSICRSIIEAHGGRLWATAAQPQGATFQFTLPAQSNQAA